MPCHLGEAKHLLLRAGCMDLHVVSWGGIGLHRRPVGQPARKLAARIGRHTAAAPVRGMALTLWVESVPQDDPDDVTIAGVHMAQRFRTPPNWPAAPEGWLPPEGWQPDPAWGPAPAGWQFWAADGPAPTPTPMVESSHFEDFPEALEYRQSLAQRTSESLN